MPRHRRHRPAPPARPERRFNAVPLVLAIGAAVVLGVVFKGTGRSEPDAPVTAVTVETSPSRATADVPPVTPPQVPAEVIADPAGRVMRVSGPDPVSVLREFCAQPGNAGMKPRWVVPAVPPSGRARLGIVTIGNDPLALYEVPIWLDRNAGRWLIGSGRYPVNVKPAREIPAGAARIPVDQTPAG